MRCTFSIVGLATLEGAQLTMSSVTIGWGEQVRTLFKGKGDQSCKVREEKVKEVGGPKEEH